MSGTGEWLGTMPPTPTHRCQLPLRHAGPDWSVWRCPCGRAYRLEPFDPGHDVQPGDGPARSWARFPEQDKGEPEGMVG